MPQGDADFTAVRKVKAPLLTKACRRLITDERFAGKLLTTMLLTPAWAVPAHGSICCSCTILRSPQADQAPVLLT